MNKTDSKKKQFILFGICSFLALVLCLVTLVVTVKKVENEAPVSDNGQQKESKTQLTADEAVLTEYIKALTAKTQNNPFIKINSQTQVNVDASAITVDGTKDGKDVQLLGFFKDRILGTVDSFYGEDFKGTFGSISEMPVVDLQKSGAECRFSVGQTDENGKQLLDDDGQLVDDDYYYLTYTVDGSLISDENTKKSYGLQDVPDVTELTKNQLQDIAEIDFISVTAGEFRIIAKVNRFTDELSQLTIKRLYDVKADFSFVNEFAVFGKKSVEFQYCVTESYDYFYAGVSLSQDSITLDVGDEAQLTVNAVIENDSEYSVKFISSDESKVTVDEMGYVKAVSESENPVKVTVELEYLGEKFCDECFVYTITQKES